MVSAPICLLSRTLALTLPLVVGRWLALAVVRTASLSFCSCRGSTHSFIIGPSRLQKPSKPCALSPAVGCFRTLTTSLAVEEEAVELLSSYPVLVYVQTRPCHVCSALRQSRRASAASRTDPLYETLAITFTRPHTVQAKTVPINFQFALPYHV